MHYVIGIGGAGTWLTDWLSRLKAGPLTLVDGDKFEHKNLDRQRFDKKAIGRNKAETLAEELKLLSIPDYYTSGKVDHTEDDWIFCCADNHAARKACLQAADLYGCRVIICANETTDAEAYIYYPAWRGTLADPRVYYPVIETDITNDPMRPAGCVELSAQNPQLVIANVAAASLASYLFWFHTQVAPKLGEEDSGHMPVHHLQNATSMRTLKLGNKLNP